jgi:hypothetical protein
MINQIFPIIFTSLITSICFADGILTDSGGEKINAKTEGGTVIPISEGAIIASGTQLQLKSGQSATISFDTGMDVLVSEESDIKINEENDISLVDLFYGEIRSFLNKQEKEAVPPVSDKKLKLIIRTPAAVVGVRGTDFIVNNDRTAVNMFTLEGNVDVASGLSSLESGTVTNYAAGESLEKHTSGSSLTKKKFNRNEFVKKWASKKPQLAARFQRAKEKRIAQKEKIKAMREARAVRRKDAKRSIQDNRNKRIEKRNNRRDKRN